MSEGSPGSELDGGAATQFVNYPLDFVPNYDDCPTNYFQNFVPNYSGAATRQVQEAVSKWKVVLDKVLEVVWEAGGSGQSSGNSLGGRRPLTHKIFHLGIAMFFALLPLVLFVCLEATAAENLRLTCAPRTFQVVPGEPVRLQLTVQADSAVPFRWQVPREPLLKLRAIEKLPVRLTAEGVVVYERVLVWQGLEPGTVKVENLSVETKGQQRRFPEVTIHIRDPGP